MYRYSPEIMTHCGITYETEQYSEPGLLHIIRLTALIQERFTPAQLTIVMTQEGEILQVNDPSVVVDQVECATATCKLISFRGGFVRDREQVKLSERE